MTVWWFSVRWFSYSLLLVVMLIGCAVQCVFLVFINHPIFQSPGSGPIEARSNHSLKWGIGDYLIETSELEEISDGKYVQFEHRMLGTYFNAFANSGFIIEQVIEKPVNSDIPLLLITVCRKLLS